jgi:hypothetical protein
MSHAKPLRKTGEGKGLRRDVNPVALPVAPDCRKVSECDAPTRAISDPDLAAIVAAWPTLPAAIRASVRAMIDAAGQGGG